MLISLFTVTAIVFISITAIAWGLTGMLIYFFPSLTFRAYRRIFIDITYITAAFFGVMIWWSIQQADYHLQSYILIVGSLIIFILSPFFATVRRKAIYFTIAWCLICLVWVFVSPIPV
jgi:hypothetical protein